MKGFRIKRAESRREVYIAGPPPPPPKRTKVPLNVIWKVSRLPFYQRPARFSLEASGPGSEDLLRYRKLLEKFQSGSDS